jgi:hypothetical protein
VGSGRQGRESSKVRVLVPSIACIRTVNHIRCVRRQQSTICPDIRAPAALREICAAVGTAWGARKTGGLNVKKYLPPRNITPARSRFKRITRGKADPRHGWGRPMTQRKKQVNARCGTAGVWDQASRERFSEITSGRSGGQQGLEDNLLRLLPRGHKPK